MSDIELQVNNLTELFGRFEARFKEMEAREAIRDVLGRYCRGIDRLDHAMIMSCYHEDAVDEHGFFTTHTAREFADVAIAGSQEAFERTFFSLGTILINVAGTSATVESYVFTPMLLREPDEEGRQIMRMGGVRFLDRFEERNGHWRIAHRRLVLEWGVFHPTPTRSHPTFKLPPDKNSPPHGRRDQSDLSYEFNPVPDSVIKER